jgi:hypothetical protein
MSLEGIKKNLNKLHHDVFYCSELKLKESLDICSKLNLIELQLDKAINESNQEQTPEEKELSDI